jgi:hypothetical protein
MAAKRCGPGGVRSVMAENLLLKQQLIVLRREGDIVAIREVGGLHDRYTNVERRDRAGTCCTRATSRLRSTRGDSEAH